jgi:hypothetical protein
MRAPLGPSQLDSSGMASASYARDWIVNHVSAKEVVGIIGAGRAS